jgi:energy-coupling factor transporter ATP-binding protein EcfA2
MVFQEPMTALNPLHTVGHQIAEPLRLHKGLDARAARAEALRLLERVHLPQARARLDAHPHQLSGGQRQRVVIAIALACAPDLLVADEPTTALDVTIQREVLDLIGELVRDSGMGLVLISHNLGVMADRVQRLFVMYGGTVSEYGPTAEVFAHHAHPYSLGLFAARPRLGLARTGLLFGMLNVAVGLWTVWVFRSSLAKPAAQVLRGAVVFALLGAGFLASDRLVTWAEKGLFGDEIIHAVTTPYQRLVITRWQDDTRLYINGNLQFSSRDEYRYHEALVHPGLAGLPWARRILVLGGGDGMALREILKYPQVESVTLVDLDPRMTELFSRSPLLSALNGNAFASPTVCSP